VISTSNERSRERRGRRFRQDIEWWDDAEVLKKVGVSAGKRSIHIVPNKLCHVFLWPWRQPNSVLELSQPLLQLCGVSDNCNLLQGARRGSKSELQRWSPLFPILLLFKARQSLALPVEFECLGKQPERRSSFQGPQQGNFPVHDSLWTCFFGARQWRET
jgi:hypothetical protein